MAHKKKDEWAALKVNAMQPTRTIIPAASWDISSDDRLSSSSSPMQPHGKPICLYCVSVSLVG